MKEADRRETADICNSPVLNTCAACSKESADRLWTLRSRLDACAHPVCTLENREGGKYGKDLDRVDMLLSLAPETGPGHRHQTNGPSR